MLFGGNLVVHLFFLIKNIYFNARNKCKKRIAKKQSGSEPKVVPIDEDPAAQSENSLNIEAQPAPHVIEEEEKVAGCNDSTFDIIRPH